MTTNRDRLDEVIDIIAARMTNAEKDAALAARIASALPERSNWFPRVWMTRLAVGALATLAIPVVLRLFYEGSTKVLPTENMNAALTIVEPPSNDRRTPVEPPVTVRRTAVEPPSNDRRTTSDGDHERSLVAIAAPEALLVAPLSPSELPADGVLTIVPLTIVDLQLSQSFSPHR